MNPNSPDQSPSKPASGTSQKSSGMETPATVSVFYCSMPSIPEKRKWNRKAARATQTNDQELSKYIKYNPDTGEFIWIRAPSRIAKVGSSAGTVREDGRREIHFKGIRYKASHIAWLLTYGTLPAGVIDHIDGNPSNDKIENLRDVSHRLNMQNTKKNIKNTSGITGVHYDKARRLCWVATIGRKIIGRFATKEQAIQARMTNLPETYTERHGK